MEEGGGGVDRGVPVQSVSGINNYLSTRKANCNNSQLVGFGEELLRDC
jgi:hypothetical protein